MPAAGPVHMGDIKEATCRKPHTASIMGSQDCVPWVLSVSHEEEHLPIHSAVRQW